MPGTSAAGTAWSRRQPCEIMTKPSKANLYRNLWAAALAWIVTGIVSAECYHLEYRPCVTAGQKATRGAMTGEIAMDGPSYLQCTRGGPGRTTCTSSRQSPCRFVGVYRINGKLIRSGVAMFNVGTAPKLSGAECR